MNLLDNILKKGRDLFAQKVIIEDDNLEEDDKQYPEKTEDLGEKNQHEAEIKKAFNIIKDAFDNGNISIEEFNEAFIIKEMLLKGKKRKNQTGYHYNVTKHNWEADNVPNTSKQIVHIEDGNFDKIKLNMPFGIVNTTYKDVIKDFKPYIKNVIFSTGIKNTNGYQEIKYEPNTGKNGTWYLGVKNKFKDVNEENLYRLKLHNHLYLKNISFNDKFIPAMEKEYGEYISNGYNELEKGEHKNHKYIRKEGDKYIYDEKNDNKNQKEGEAKLFDRPEMEYPIYRVIVNEKERFIQRMDGMNPGDTAWYEVEKNQKGEWQMLNGVNPSLAVFLGFNKKEAIEDLYRSNFLEKSKLFPEFIDGLDKFLSKNKKKKHSTATIIRNNEGKILFVRRASNDDFHPLTYCLPGGGIDEGETSTQGAIREIKEEIGLTIDEIDLELLGIIDLPEICIYYFITDYPYDEEVVLQGEELQQYEWLGIDEWIEEDLILDLKQHLIDLIYNDEVEKGVSSNKHYDYVIVHNKQGKTFQRKQLVGKKQIEKQHIYDDKYQITSDTVKELEKLGVNVYGGALSIKTETYNKYFSEFNLHKYFSDVKDTFIKEGIDPKKINMEVTFNMDQTIDIKSYSGKGNANKFTLERTLYRKDGKNIVKNHEFRLAKELQGKGIAKTILRNQNELCKKSNVSFIHMKANIKDTTPINGCNTWSKFGFKCKMNEAYGILSSIKNDIGAKRDIGNNEIYEITEDDYNKTRDLINKFYTDHSEDTLFPVIKIDELFGNKIAKGVMQKSEWEGILDYSDEESMKIWNTQIYKNV